MALGLSGAAPVVAQSLGTFRWQLQPFCNVITVNVTQNGSIYTLDGYDDQCGAPTRAPMVGIATPNPDGTIGFGFQIVTTPAATPVAVRASVSLATVGGPWSDDAGNSGIMVLNGADAGGSRPTGAALSAASVRVSGQLTAQSAEISGSLTAVKANLGLLTATSLNGSSLTTPALQTDGASDVHVTGWLRAGGSLLAGNGRLYANGFGIAPAVALTRYNGSTASPTAVVAGDRLGSIDFVGSQGQFDIRPGAAIDATATESWSVGNGTSLTFRTGPNGSTATLPRLFIDHNGEVGIGTVSPDQLLSVNGHASKVGGGTWAVFSDERLKHVRGTFTRGLADVLRLQPIRFEYRADNPLGLRGQGEYVGFSAQAVRDVVPEAVSVSEGGYLQLHGDPLLWTMLNAIKELEARTRAENERLRAELEDLRRAVGPPSR